LAGGTRRGRWGRPVSGGFSRRQRGVGRGGATGDRAANVGTRNWGRDGLWRRAHGGAEAAACGQCSGGAPVEESGRGRAVELHGAMDNLFSGLDRAEEDRRWGLCWSRRPAETCAAEAALSSVGKLGPWLWGEAERRGESVVGFVRRLEWRRGQWRSDAWLGRRERRRRDDDVRGVSRGGAPGACGTLVQCQRGGARWRFWPELGAWPASGGAGVRRRHGVTTA